MKDFEFYFPTKIIFGKEALRRFPKELPSLGRRCLLLYGRGSIKKTGLYEKIISCLKQSGLEWTEFGGIKSNPPLSQVLLAVEKAQEFKPDFLLAVGGGSVIDAAKAIACGYFHRETLWDFFERRGAPQQALPLIVISTIAGTGSEANEVSVIVNDKKGYKLSLRSPLLFPKITFLDPTLTFTVPPNHTAYGVMDAFSHLFEYLMFRAYQESTVTEDILILFMKDLLKWGFIAYKEPENYLARSQIQWLSLLALSPLTRAGLGSYRFFLHSLEHPLSGSLDLPHGLGLAILMRAYLKRYGAHETVRRFYLKVLDLSQGPDLAKRGLKAYDEILERFELPKSLKDLQIKREVLPDLVEKAWEILYIWKAERDFSKEDIQELYEIAYSG